MNGLHAVTRRGFLGSAGMAAAYAVSPLRGMAQAAKAGGFRVAVISDEISQDLDHACSVASKDFGMEWIELREVWGKNLQEITDAQIAEARAILAKYKLRVTDIASPLFKVDFPGAPKSPYGSKADMHGAAEVTFQKQAEVLARSIALAKQFGTDKVRCFDFWRLEDQAPFRAAINEQLRKAAETCGQQGIVLVLENEFACNTATGRESAAVLNAVKTPHLALNWDPGNAVMRGEMDAFPGGWATIPKDRIHHCHVKNAVKNDAGKIEWAPVGTGYVDWKAQFAALHAVGYKEAVSLETHWKGPGGPEASTRTSWGGMKAALAG